MLRVKAMLATPEKLAEMITLCVHPWLPDPELTDVQFIRELIRPEGKRRQFFCYQNQFEVTIISNGEYNDVSIGWFAYPEDAREKAIATLHGCFTYVRD